MKQLLPDLDRWQREGEPIALATLVRVRGAAPRLPGARLFMTRSGRMAGSVSGGCVESDVFERAMQVLDSGEAVVATYGISDELGFEIGLSCGGSIDVLIEPFATDEAWTALRGAVEEQRAVAIAIGLAPASILGRKLVLLGDGGTVGSVDPGVDEEVAAAARGLLLEGGTRVVTPAGREEETVVFVEALPPPPHLLLVGATHIAMPLSRMAKELGYRVSVIDARSVFATQERFPEADAVIREWPDKALDRIPLDAYSYVVILTHDPKFDLPTLTRALRSPARYIGAMGSRGTHAQRTRELREQGFSDADIARIRAPIGLNIGGRAPEEIAVAIVAELVAARYGRDERAPGGQDAAMPAGR
ncbi:MAG: XdhC/CoxI family protein [Dehalococcoidia bacterium]